MLEKNIFRERIKEILLDFMLEGLVRPGERLSLPQIADKLEVSVTPIREALTQLAETGIVSYKANRGFFVTSLSKKEATDIYHIIALLEGEAVKNSVYSAEDILALKQCNDAFSKPQSPREKLLLDRSFHQKLIANYTNSYAQKIIENIRIRVFMYEFEFMDAVPTEESSKMHAAIIQALERGKNSEAIQHLRANWELSVDQINKQYAVNANT